MFNNEQKQNLPIYYFWGVIIFKLYCFLSVLKKSYKRLFDNIWLLLLQYKEIWKLDLQ